MAFCLKVAALDTDIIRAVQIVSSGKRAASTLAPQGRFCRLGTRWGTIVAAGSARGSLRAGRSQGRARRRGSGCGRR